jgi:HSP20 family protein
MAETKKKMSKPSKAAQTSKDVKVVKPADVSSPFDVMDRWFENVYPRGWMQPFHREWPSWGELGGNLDLRAPKVDVIDRDNEIIVRAEVPGLKKEDLDVSITDSTVTIKGETKHEEKEEKGDYYRHEIARGSFARTVKLPHEVGAEGSKAKFKDGVLELTLPKVENAKRRTITIE